MYLRKSDRPRQAKRWVRISLPCRFFPFGRRLICGDARGSSPPAAPVIDAKLPAPLSMGAILRITMMRRLWYAQTISVLGDFCRSSR
jgi:hypothetical protein